MKKAKYIGESYKVRLQKGKIYEVISEKYGWFQILDETDDLGYFPSDEFEVI